MQYVRASHEPAKRRAIGQSAFTGAVGLQPERLEKDWCGAHERNMHITPTGIQLIRRFEGFSPTPYLCPAGYLTIGYGHVVRAGEVWERLTEQEAESLLREDVQVAENAVKRLMTVPLTIGQYDALVSFTFNLGAGALQRSALRRKLNRGDIQGAADEFPRWVWAGGIKLKGLILRRAAERARFLEG